MKTILVPTDLSPLANVALPVAVSLAAQNQASVRVLHYLNMQLLDPSLSMAPVSVTHYMEEQEAQTEAELKALCMAYQTELVPVEPVLSRDPNGLFGAVQAEEADLVVLASHGADGWAEWLIGSNAEHFVETADCPVLIVKKAYQDFRPRRILYAIDADDRLKTQFVQPLPASDSPLQFLFIAIPHDPRLPEGIRNWMVEFAQAQELSSYHLSIEPAHTTHEGIIQFAQANNFEVIVLFTSQRKGFWHFLNGSVAEAVVNHSPIPVLVVPFA